MVTQPAPPEAAAPAFVDGVCAATARRWLLIAAILASAMGFIDGTVVAIALPAMRDSLDASLQGAQWIANAYTLALSALVLVGGALGDRLGPIRVFAAGIALFTLASLACAIAPTAGTLIAARAVQGLGAAAMVPGSLALIARVYPPEERGRAIGTWAAASAVTTAAGPILGGLLLTAGGAETWRLIFAVNLPVGALALWLLFRHTRRDPAATATGIDWLGGALVTAGLAALAMALTGAEHGETGLSLRDLALGAIGVALLVAFVAQERRSPHPMLPLDVFALPGFAAANLATFLLYAALSGLLFFLPMAAISAWGVSELEAAATMLPLTILVGTLSSRIGALADRIGPGRPIATGAALVAMACLGLAVTAPLQAFWAATIPLCVLLGFGMALVVAPLSTAVMAHAGDARSGIASGVNNAVARTAGLVAVAALGPVAAAAYAGAGGLDSFGAPSATDLHGPASSAALAAVCLVAAASAGLAALTAWRGLSALTPKGE